MPQFNGTILRARSNHVVVEWIPGKIQYIALVTTHFRIVEIKSTSLHEMYEI